MSGAQIRSADPISEHGAIRWMMIGGAIVYIAIFLLLPVATVFSEALAKGFGAYVDAVTEDDAVSAIKLTLITAAIAVPLNVVFGIAASWVIAKFEFRGKSVL